MSINLFSKDLGIDLGTANTLVFCKGKGIVLREPSVVAVRKTTFKKDEVMAIGLEAKKMLGRAPKNIYASRPLKDGAIADFELTEIMLKYFIKKTLSLYYRIGVKPRVVICIPFGITDVERRAVEEVALSAGAREAILLEEPLAAAIGAGLPTKEAIGSMIVDIGGGTTEVAIISLGGIVCCKSIRIGGYAMNEALINHIKKNYNILIGEAFAEQLKFELSIRKNDNSEEYSEVNGLHMFTGLPKTIMLTKDELFFALKEPLQEIIQTIKDTLETTPPDLAADIILKGIYLSGGASQIKGIDKLIVKETGLNVYLAENPLDCVVNGAAEAIDYIKEIKKSYTNDFMWN